MSEDLSNFINNPVDIFGVPCTVDGAAEEATELAHALLKYARWIRGVNPTDAAGAGSYSPEDREVIEEKYRTICRQELTHLLFYMKSLELWPSNIEEIYIINRFMDRMRTYRTENKEEQIDESRRTQRDYPAVH